MITIEELRQKFIKRHYFIDDKLLWWTYTKINKQFNGLNNEISALCISGPSGTGKTTYVNILKDILNEVLKDDIKLISFLCDYDNENSNIADNEKTNSILNKELIVEAINEANNGSKVILFIDGYDENDQLVDLYLLRFLRIGNVKDSDGSLVELKDKNNLQLIIASNDISDLLDSVKQKLDIVNLKCMDSLKILNYVDNLDVSINNSIKYLIVYLYNELEVNGFDQNLPSIFEITKLINNVQFLITSKAPTTVINELIFETMLKYVSNYKEFYNSHQMYNLNASMWNEENIVEELISKLDYKNDIQLLLFSKLKDKPIEVINNNLNKTTGTTKIFSLLATLQHNLSPLTINKSKRANKEYEVNEYGELSWAYDNLLTNNESRKWFKVASLNNVNIDNLKRFVDGRTIINEGVLLHYHFYPDESKYINRLILQCDQITDKLCNLSFYSSDPIVSGVFTHRLFNFMNAFSFDLKNSNVSIAMFLEEKIENNELLSLVERDMFFPNIYYYSGNYKHVLYNSILNMNYHKEVITYVETRDCNYIIPTTILRGKSINYRLHKETLKIGKFEINIKLKDKYNYFEKNLIEVAGSKVAKIYNTYLNDRFSLSSIISPPVFLIAEEKTDFNKVDLAKGICIVNQGSKEEFMLINPYIAFYNPDDYKKAIYETNIPFVKKLMI